MPETSFDDKIQNGMQYLQPLLESSKGCTSHWVISWLQNPHSKDKQLGSWGGKYLGSGGIFRGGEGSWPELLPQSQFCSLSCLFLNCINRDVINCFLFCYSHQQSFENLTQNFLLSWTGRISPSAVRDFILFQGLIQDSNGNMEAWKGSQAKAKLPLRIFG